MQSNDIEALEPEFVINTKPTQGRSRLVSIVSVGLAVSGVALLVSTTSGKSVSVQNDASTISTLNVVDRRVTRSGDFERNLASSPTKSPSSGVHKPTWKPSSKPVEHASKQGAALPKHRELGLKPVAAQKSSNNADGVNLVYYPSESTTTTSISTPLTSATTASNAKTAIAASMPVGGTGPITPEGAPTGPLAPILAATPVAMAMTVRRPPNNNYEAQTYCDNHSYEFIQTKSLTIHNHLPTHFFLWIRHHLLYMSPRQWMDRNLPFFLR